jgi:hypothetical protein
MKKSILLLAFLAFSLFSCSKDDKNDTDDSYSNSIVGKWYWYQNVEGNSIIVGAELCDNYPNCRTYEFKSNGTCIFVEKGYTTASTYKIDGDFLKLYNPKTEALEETIRILGVSKDELVLDETDEINTYKRK